MRRLVSSDSKDPVIRGNSIKDFEGSWFIGISLGKFAAMESFVATSSANSHFCQSPVEGSKPKSTRQLSFLRALQSLMTILAISASLAGSRSLAELRK